MWIADVDVDVEQQQRQKDGSAYLVIRFLLQQLLQLRKADTVESDEDLFSAASAESSSR